MADKDTTETVGIGIGLTHDAASSAKAESAILQTMEQLTGKITKSFNSLTKEFTPLTASIQTLTKGIEELSTRFTVSTEKVSKGCGHAKKAIGEMGEAAKATDKSIDNTTKKMAEFFQFAEGSAKFNKLGKAVNEALQFNGVETGMKKLTTMRDMVMQVGNEIAKVGSKKSFSLMGDAKGDLSNVKFFSLDKYKAEVEKAKADYQKLFSFSSKNGATDPALAKFEAMFNSPTFMSRGNNSRPLQSLDFVKELRSELAEVQRSLENSVSSAKSLRSAALTVVAAEVEDARRTRTTAAMQIQAQIEDRKRQSQPYEDLLSGAGKQGLKYVNGDLVPKGYLSEAKAQEEAEKIRANLKKEATAIDYGRADIERSLKDLQVGIDSFNKSKGTAIGVQGSVDTSKIVDVASLKAAQHELKNVVSETENLKKVTSADLSLDRQLKAEQAAAHDAATALQVLIDRQSRLNDHFNNVTNKTVVPDGPGRLSAVQAAQAAVQSGISSFTGDPKQLDTIRESLRQLDMAMRNFSETGSRIKNSTGSPFDNLFKGIPAFTVSVNTMQQQVQAACTAAGKNLQSLDSAELGKIQKQLKTFGYTINQTSGEIKELAKNANATKGLLSWLPESFGGMAGRLAEFYSLRTVMFAVGNQFRAATTAALDMNQAVHDILAISGDSKDQFQNVSDSIYEIAKSSRFTTKEVAGLMQVLAQAGVSGKDLGSVSKSVGMFATATASDPKLAADLTTTAMNVYSIKAEEVARVTNAMTAALNLSKLETAGLGTAFNYLAPQSAELGISLEKTLAIIATMAQSGIKPSTIGTGVSQMLKEFAAPKQRLKDMLTMFKLTPQDIDPIKHDFADIVQTLQKAGVTVDQLFKAMETRVGRTAVTAINLSAESFRNMEANLTGTSAAMLAYDKTMEGAHARMNVVKQSFNELASAAGDALAPALVWTVGALQDLIAVFSSENGRIAKLSVEIIGITAALGGLLVVSRGIATSAAMTGIIGMFKAVPGIATEVVVAIRLLSAGAITLGDAFAVATGGIASFFAGLSLTTALLTGGIAIAIAAVAYGIYKVVDAMGAERREREEASKKQIEAIDTNARFLKTSNDIIHSTQESSEAYKQYQAALASGKTHEEALALVKGKVAKATVEQLKELAAFVAEGGPQAKYIEQLVTENRLLEAGILLNRTKKQEMAGSVHTSISRYNSAMEAHGDFKQEAINATKPTGMTPEKWRRLYESGDRAAVREVDREAKKRLAAWEKDGPAKEDAAYLAKVLGSMVDMDNSANPKQGLVMRNGSGAYGLRTMEEPKKPNTMGGDHGGSHHKYDGLMVNPAMQQEITGATEQKQAIITSLKDEYHTDAELEVEYAKLRALNKRIADLQEEMGEGKSAKAFLDKDGKWSAAAINTWKTDSKIRAEYKRALAADEARKASNLAKNTAELDKIGKEVKTTQDAIDKKVRQATADAHREAEERDLVDLKREIADAYTSEEDRQFAIGEAKVIAASLAIAKINRDIADLEKQKADPHASPETKAQLQKLINGKEDDKDAVPGIVSKEIEDAGVVGGKASSDKLLKIERERLQVKQEALVIETKEAVGYAKVKQLEIESLATQQSSLETQAKIAQKYYDYVMLHSTDKAAQEAAKADLDIILQKTKEINYELAKRKQNQWDNVKDGANGAWTEFGNIDKASKDLGASVVTTGLNGMVKVIDDSITKLSQLKWSWRDFGKSLGNIMKDIAAQLQTYVIKMLVVWSVQKLIGMVPSGSSIGGDTGQFGGTNSSIFGQMGTVRPTFPSVFAKPNALGGLQVGGIPGKDSILSWTMPGEVVIKKSSVDAIGLDKLLYANEHGKLPRFANGGAIGGGKGNSHDSPLGNLTIINVADPSSIPPSQPNETQIVNIVSFALDKNASFRQKVKSVAR